MVKCHPIIGLQLSQDAVGFCPNLFAGVTNRANVPPPRMAERYLPGFFLGGRSLPAMS
jgi:hypothetical protein